MPPEEQLALLEADLKAHFGAWTRYRNDCVQNDATSVEEKLAIASTILRSDPVSGVARHMYESQRKRELGWTD
jgi:hypothetical protein